jgi:hypothetical protein
MRKHTSGLAWMAATLFFGGAVDAVAQTGASIFYSTWTSNAMTAYRMNADGTGKTTLFDLPRYGGQPICSSMVHAGGRWFVKKADPGWATYQYAPEIQFYSESGDVRVFALDYGTLDPELLGEANTAKWVPGDLEITFPARRVVDGQVVEAGLFAVAVQYTADVPSGISSPYLKLSTPTTLDGEFGIVPAVQGGHDWNPTGTAAVCSTNSQLYVVNSAGTVVLRNGSIAGPLWAPGTVNRVLFSEGGAICTIGTNGLGWKKVHSIKTSATTWLESPVWSFDGASILYTLFKAGQNGGRTIYKISASGSGNRSMNTQGNPMAWK